jgi:hypothetical protein
MSGRVRANGEGSIFPYRNGFAAYVWVNKPDGKRARKYVYGKTREIVHEKWIALHQQARQGPVATRVPTLGDYLTYWLTDVVEPNLAPLTAATYETFVRLHISPDLGASDSTGSRSATFRPGSTCRPRPASAALRARMHAGRKRNVAAARSCRRSAAVTFRPATLSVICARCCGRPLRMPRPGRSSPRMWRRW